MILNKKIEGSDIPHVFDGVQDLGNIDYVKNGKIYKNAQCVGVMITSSSDLALLDEYGVGTLAFTAGFTSMWQKDIDGVFVQMIGD